MALKQQLQLKQQQKLSPLQMQVIKLTELPILELEEKIKQEIEDNPALEEGEEYQQENSDDTTEPDDVTETTSSDEIVLGDYLTQEDMPDFQLAGNKHSSFERKEDIPFSSGESLHEYLLEQLGLTKLSDQDKQVATYIIGNIDKNGYLERPLSAIADDLLFQQNIEVNTAHLEQMLEVIQGFEPAGVAARTLQECLLLQLKRLPHDTSTHTAISIVTDYFEEFSKKHYERILKRLEISEEDLKAAMNEIISLNPKPGNTWGDALAATLNTVVPDFLVESINGEVYLTMNQKDIPPLKVNKEYSEIFRGYTQNKAGVSSEVKSAMLFVKQKLDAARWFIEAVKQRQDTLQRTMQAIIDLQYDFFLTGDEVNLRPMILKDVAERTLLDISTISRVTNSKYVQTNFGIFPLKYFFSESMHNEAGEEVSAHEVKKILKESIRTEDTRHPLTDDKLAGILRDKGYLIARRTVAKYREQMNIPVARLRKQI